MKVKLQLTILFVTTSVLLADVPMLMNYQGILKDIQGQAVADGAYLITFSLYIDSTGGTTIWSENQVVATQNGIFHALLGSIETLPNFPANGAYVGLAINYGPELLPRKRIVSVGYAFQSQNSFNAEHSSTSDSSTYSSLAQSAISIDGYTAENLLPITAYGHVDAVTCQPSTWTTLLEVTITIPDTMYIYSHGTVSGGGWFDSQRMLQLSIYDEGYATFYNYAHVWGDVTNSVHLLPGGTYHIQLYGLSYASAAQDMGNISLYAYALNPSHNNTFRVGPFPPPNNAILPDPTSLK